MAHNGQQEFDSAIVPAERASTYKDYPQAQGRKIQSLELEFLDQS